jgi:formylglycine-generating enzyme required for sulfatase activity
MTLPFPTARRCFAVLALASAVAVWGAGEVTPMRPIPAGTYEPLLRTTKDPAKIAVPAFLLDERPVTNAEYLAFVTANPKWRRSQVARLFADESYLQHWSGDLEPGPAAPPGAPVVRVSWFAARAYARWAGKRLPTTAEWELTAAAG